MPPERVRRQQPVSCSHCRGRKLRCDRQLPCSSCRSRDIACVYASQRAAVDAYGKTSVAETSSDGSDELLSLRAEHEALKARFSTIERIVLGTYGESSTSASSATVPKNHAAITATQPPASPDSDDVVAWTSDPQWLDRMGVQNMSSTSSLGDYVSIGVSTLRHLISTDLEATLGKPLLIPSFDEAAKLYSLYLERHDTIQHIFYKQHVNDAMTQMYLDVQYERPYKPSHLALLLAIFANVAETCDLSPTAGIAHQLAMYWLKGSLDVLENIWRSQTSDMETIQAIVILIYQLYHVEVFSSKARLLHATAVSLAKDIGLHKTNSSLPVNDSTLSRDEIIQKEIRRRIWWQLTAIDWAFLLSSGLHEGSYSINPRHMQVKKPRNINDEDLATMPADFSRPYTEPTTMAFYLHCIRTSELCREVADITWDLKTSQMDDTLYDCNIIPLDEKFQDLLSATPPFLKIGFSDPNEPVLPTRMVTQRYFNYLVIQTRRCRLHLPYLMQTGSYRSYRFSRYVCLEAARSILELRDRAPSLKSDAVSTSNAAWTFGFKPHFFFATTVLVMDFSFNRDAVDEAERKAEIESACTIFEDSSTSGRFFLDILKAVMQKHKLRMKGYIPERSSGLIPEGHNITVGYNEHAAMETENPTLTSDADLNLNELWQSYLDTDPGLQEWDELLSHLHAGVQ